MAFSSKYEDTGKKLGSGQYGTAWLVTSKETGQLLVMKRFNVKLVDASELKYAKSEIVALHKLNHPNVVQYVDSYENPDHFCIVMEFASGGTLGGEIETKKRFKPSIPFTDSQVFRWGGQMLSAIDYIHRQKVMHRDIKPDNVFLSGEKDVKLGDFGVVKMTDGSLKGGTLMGTPAYMALEIFLANESNLKYSAKVDEWSAGIVIFELATLERPFTARDIKELIRNLSMRKFAVPLTAIKNQELYQVIDGLLRKDPQSRFSAKEALDSCSSMKCHDPLAKEEEQEAAPAAENNDDNQQASDANQYPMVGSGLPRRNEEPASPAQSLPPVKLQTFKFQEFFQELKDLGDGTGTFGNTTVVREIATGKTSIVKMLLSGLDATKLEKLKREIEALLKLKHPQLISYKEHFETTDGDYYVRLEFFRNRSLASLIERHSKNRMIIQETAVFGFCAQLCLALKFLHDKGITHRDVKPSNIFLKEDTHKLKLGDCGIVKELIGPSAIIRSFSASASYLAPELTTVATAGLWSPKTDMFSLGCVLYELATFKKAFAGDGNSQRLSKEKSAIVSEMKKDYSDGLIDLIANLLARSPELRPTAGQVLIIPKVGTAAQAFTAYDNKL